MRALFATACAIPLLVLLAFAAFVIREFWVVGVVADPAILSSYPFGAEGPVAGIEHYASPKAYANHSLVVAIACVGLAALFIIAWCRKSRLLLAAAYVVTVSATLWSASGSL
jgi:hypothetical protein